MSFFSNRSKVTKRSGNKVVRKHYRAGSFFSHRRTVTTYKTDWLGRKVSVQRNAHWWE